MKSITRIKYTIYILFLLAFTSFAQESKIQSIDREPIVAGSYYPSDSTELNRQLELFFESVKPTQTTTNARAIIVPHAGYIFSGSIAASAYAQIDRNKKISRVFLIGTSHHVLLNGASVYNIGNYRTPLGTAEVDIGVANNLIKSNSAIGFAQGAHTKEHSLEVQLPFLQYWLKHSFKIVPIIIGTQSDAACKEIANALKPYFNEENLFVISTDFSHYPRYYDALKTDKITGDALQSNSPEKFINTLLKTESEKTSGLSTSCCGWSSVLTLLHITSEMPGIKYNHIQYSNSGDSPYGDKNRVVGYHSFIVNESKNKTESKEFTISDNDKKKLLEIARSTITAFLENGRLLEINSHGFSENMKTSCGAFVTLNKNHRLRGCIGRFLATEPLYKVVQEMAIAAAVNDTRFQKVVASEMKDIEVEISVLTPLKKIETIDEFILGKHGIYIIKGNRSGTYLPQVAQQTGWNTEEFLGNCARDKAGIGYDGWKDADLYIYEALVFSESELTVK